MLPLLADENISAALFKALHDRGCDIVRVQEVGLQAADDPAIFAWAAEQRWVVVAKDRQTMP